MYCPQCSREYPEESGHCSECGAALVDQPPSPETTGAEDLCALLQTTDVAQLMVIKSLLDSADIPYSVQGEEGLHQIPIRWSGGFFHSGAHGAVIRVRAGDLEDARRLIEERPDLPPQD